ncbi:MAG: sulfite exporter TauE/SafE family protein [Candidatus Omnitrophota bacterium]
MNLLFQQILYFIIGFFAGLSSGIFGIGGGSIRTPLLFLAGLPLRTAFGINFLVIPFSSFIGAFTHRKNIAKEIIVWAVVLGVLGELIGAFHVGIIPVKFLAILYVVICFMLAFGIFWNRFFPVFAKKFKGNKTIFGLSSFVISYITGLRGGSGGQVFPALFKTLGLSTRRAIATSLVVSTFTALGAIPIYWQRGDLVWLPAVFVLIGSVAGVRIGSLFSLKTKPLWLEIGLAFITVILALLVLVKVICLN